MPFVKQVVHCGRTLSQLRFRFLQNSQAFPAFVLDKFILRRAAKQNQLNEDTADVLGEWKSCPTCLIALYVQVPNLIGKQAKNSI
jgi:hypothetical protein